MVNFAVVIATVAALAGQAIAAPPIGPTCNPGQKYCGYNLLNNKATYDLWYDRVIAAQPGISDPYKALYTCVTPTSLSYDDFCPRLGQSCQPAESGKCGPAGSLSDCCAA